ncbi:MAG: heme NO-binding domain-containing protein [Gammaproteobacteria bacterium]|nr:heme NO-binding domain-containing protein [Gammaproteobacteria bacterium]
MKGIVFAEFIEFVEDTFSNSIADQMIDQSELDSKGAYTSVGTYHHEEILELVTNLARITDSQIPDLVRKFGKHLFGRLTSSYPSMLYGVDHCFDFLELIENHIHVEVKKLYPDAELPHFDSERVSDTTLILTYHSSRPFAQLALGLMEGSIEHFNEPIRIETEGLEPSENCAMRFTLHMDV